MTIRFDGSQMERDCAAKGWSGSELARRAKVSQMTVSRVFRGGAVRPETAKRLATALGQDLARYLVVPEPTPV